jgi:hypothetical protein
VERAVVRFVVVAALSAAPGCRQILGLDSPVASGVGADAAGDAAVGDSRMDGVPDGAVCFGEKTFTICLASAPTGTLSLGGQILTDTDARCLPSQPADWSAAGQPDACIITAGMIQIGAPGLVAMGPRPLVLVANDSLDVSGVLDVSSHVTNGAIGAAAGTATCPSGSLPGDNNNGAGGGAGGSFMSSGGDGGNGVGIRGTAGPKVLTPPSLLRGGCNGQAGGQGQSQVTPGAYGGGAVYLVAGGSMMISGVIDASGAGGGAPLKLGGGPGGGSGGMIVLYAPTISFSGAIAANGGGGASGADNLVGDPGHDPDPAAPTQPASGGQTGGGPGGRGAAGNNQATQGGSAGSRGGGGGGGGLGYVRSNVALSNGLVSPTPDIQ